MNGNQNENAECKINMEVQMSNEELSEAIKYVYNEANNIGTSNPLYSLLSRHLEALLEIQFLRAKSCSVYTPAYPSDIALGKW